MANNSNGEIVYEAKIDDSQVEKEIERVTKKIEKSLKESADKTSKFLKTEVDEVAKHLDVMAEEAEQIASNMGGVLKDLFSDAVSGTLPLVGQIDSLTAGLSGVSSVAVQVGAAVIDVAALAVDTTDEMNAAMNEFLAITGVSIGETERYQKILEDIYANNYGESFSDIASAMAEVRTQMGATIDGWDDTAIQRFTESAFELKETFEVDIADSVKSAGVLMNQFGVDSEYAFALLTKGMQEGLNSSGDLLNSINEYSSQFRNMGFGIDEMFRIFQKGAETGAFSLKEVVSAMETMRISVITGNGTMKEEFATLGLNADEIITKFKLGGDAAKEAFNQTIDALAKMEDPMAQSELTANLMGEAWSNLGTEAVEALADIEEGAYATGEELGGIKDMQCDNLNSMLEELLRNLELLLVPLGDALLPILTTLIESILPVLIGVLTPLIDILSKLLEPILDLVATAITPLMDALSTLIMGYIEPLIPLVEIVISSVTTRLSGVLDTITKIVENGIAIFRNMIDFIKNVFTGDWKAAFENVVEIFRRIFSNVETILKAPINGVIDGWNSMAKAIGDIEIPEWVPIVGGKTLKFPQIQRLKIGLDYVPNDMFPAYLDQGEWVLTREEANLLRSLGGLEGVVDKLECSNNSGVNITVQSDSNVDYSKMGTAVAEALIESGVEFRCDGREFARLVRGVK